MPGTQELTAEQFAELVRPAINRVQRGVRERALAAGSADLPRRYGLPHPGLVDELRFVLPREPLPRQAFALAARYEPVGTVQAQVDELLAGGWGVGPPGRRFRPRPGPPPLPRRAVRPARPRARPMFSGGPGAFAGPGRSLAPPRSGQGRSRVRRLPPAVRAPRRPARRQAL